MLKETKQQRNGMVGSFCKYLSQRVGFFFFRFNESKSSSGTIRCKISNIEVTVEKMSLFPTLPQCS
jgi:hypothetical protein